MWSRNINFIKVTRVEHHYITGAEVKDLGITLGSPSVNTSKYHMYLGF